MSAELPLYDSGAIRSRAFFELRELWRYQFLLRNLIVRDLKVRYKRSALGFIWVMLSPLLTMGVLALVFSRLFGITKVPHPIPYILCGLLIWNVFAQGTVAATSNLLGNGSVLRRMYVPPSVFIASSIGSAFVNLLFSLVPFVLLSMVTGLVPSLTWLLLVIPCLLVSLFAFGVGLFLGGLAVFFTDIVEIYNVLLMVYMYLTAVFYPPEVLPVWLRGLEDLNPMYIFITLARDVVIYGQVPSITHYAISGAIALGAFIIGWLVFTRLETKFAYHF